MKKLILLFLLFPLLSHATVYYFSASGSDSNSGTSTSSPYQTITKFNALTKHAGDQFLFHCGDTFTGAMTLSASGTSTNPIIIGQYGTGANPIITGIENLTSWSLLSGNIYQCTDVNLASTLNILLVNGMQQPVGRFPKTGYNKYTSFSGSSSITDPTLPDAPNYPAAGSQLVIRKQPYVLCAYPLTLQSGHVLTYAGGGGINCTANYGYFIQNSPQCLTQQNDWYYDGSGHVQIYSSGAPTGIKATRYNTLLTISGNYITVNGVDFYGANLHGIYSSNRTGILIENCHISYCGVDGMFHNNASYAEIKHNVIDHCNNAGIMMATWNNVNIVADTINYIGMIPGSGQNIGGSYGYYSGIGACCQTGSINDTVTSCQVSYCGYNGISLKGGFYCVNNVIHDCTSIIDDGGCLYTDVGTTATAYSPNRVISGNIIYNAIGAPLGSDGNKRGVGLYCDDNSSNITISGNTVYGASQYNYFLHNAHEITFSNNTGYNAGVANLAMVHDNIVSNKLLNISLTGNKLIAMPGQYCVILKSISNVNSIPSDLNTWGNASGNYYGSTFTNSTPFQTQIYALSAISRSLASWQSITTQDGSSTYQDILVSTQFPINPTSSTVPFTRSNNYKELSGIVHNAGTLNVSAFNSYFLIFTSAPAPPVHPTSIKIPKRKWKKH